MKIDHIDIISRSAAAFADGGGLRAGAEAAVKHITDGLACNIAFIARSRADGGIADINAAIGLGAADFRRLEERITKSNLWRIFQLESPLAIDNVGVDPVLNFLAFGAQANFLIAVPVKLKGSTVGMIGAGFQAASKVDEKFAVKILNALSPIVAQAIRLEYTVNEESRRLREENTFLKHELKSKYDFSHLIGNSSPMRQVYDQVSQVARSNATVLLRGESGTGKELIANAIHYNSLRSKRPFIKVNCAALPENQIESELFGFEKNAFAGTTTRKEGRFELADGGTLFLDEIGELPKQTQVKILRVLEEREFQRPGGSETIKLNVRLIAATNKDLEDSISAGNFLMSSLWIKNGRVIDPASKRDKAGGSISILCATSARVSP